MKRTVLPAFCVWVAIAFAQERPTTAIKVDQVGYLPSASKVALVSTAAQRFAVKRASDGAIVFQGRLASPIHDADTGDTVQAADFSPMRMPGTYYLDVPGVGRSWNFAIGPDVFSRPYYLAMRAFYGQRCGTAVDLGTEFPGYKHAACHRSGAFDPSSGKQGRRDNVGGWHDAGDYGRYLPSSSIATGTLLWSWELFAAQLKPISLNIPESGNGTPDILNETRWDLEWMLKMQDSDGGVWHKQTSAKFPGFIMPEADTAPALVIGTGSEPYKSTCATAGLAAVAAMAARVYKPFDAAFAAVNLAAARKAWEWADAHPDVTFRNPAGISTGEYGDTHCGDERLWAAAELWRTTGETAYERYFTRHYGEYLPTLQSPAGEGWRDMAPMGLWAYAFDQRGDSRVAGEIRRRLLQAAREVAARTRRSAYRVSMTAKDYVWGSNGVAANYGMQLLIAYRIKTEPAFAEAAADDLHYLLGRNTFSLSWVTQVGANPYRHPHHRPSGADNNVEPWPGLLSGGPNANRQDAFTRALPPRPPAKVYGDDQDSYASNEVAINWQAMLVFVLASQLQQQ
jgi:endoglucanase